MSLDSDDQTWQFSLLPSVPPPLFSLLTVDVQILRIRKIGQSLLINLYSSIYRHHSYLTTHLNINILGKLFLKIYFEISMFSMCFLFIPLQEREVDPLELSDLKHYYRYAAAAYGYWWYVLDRPARNCLALGQRLSCFTNCCCCCLPCLQLPLGSPPVLFYTASYRMRIHIYRIRNFRIGSRPSFFVATEI